MAYHKGKGKLHERDHSYKHEKDFRVAARRNKLLGLWAAELMNIRGAEAEAYAKQVVSADLDEPGDEDGAQGQQRFRTAWRVHAARRHSQENG
jgi:hypothetical protein